MITLGFNSFSSKSLRQINRAEADLSRVFERLSSGQRINRASDDAAGLAIADSLHAARRVTTQAIRNAGDGLSLLNIADAALNQLSEVVIRQRELAEQSANGVYTQEQRSALDREGMALQKEFNRIVKTTVFNGRDILDAPGDEIRIQIGSGLDGSIAFSVLESQEGVLSATGTFAAPNDISAASGPGKTFASDINGDGILDLLALKNDDEVTALLGNGDGTFQTPINSSTGFWPRDMAKGDLNGDGFEDVVTVEEFTNSATVLLGNGDGTFSSSAVLTTGDRPVSVAVGDINRDGFLDIATADTNSASVSTFLGDGVGGFGPRSSVSMGLIPKSVGLADLNRDGRLDLITTEQSLSSVRVKQGFGNGSFSGTQTTYGTGGIADNPTFVDLNSDGYLDMAFALQANDQVSVLLGNGAGGFNPYNTYSTGDAPGQITSGDFNGDGTVDLIAANQNSSTLSFLAGNGDGTFAPASAIQTGNLPSGVAAGDFNSDGVLDLATGNAVHTISVLIGESDTTGGTVASLAQSPFNLLSQGTARQALDSLSEQLQTILSARAQVGAVQSRLSTALSTLASTRENYSSAEERIRGADLAEDSAKLTRLKILRETGGAVLAQANTQPQLALRLLG